MASKPRPDFSSDIPSHLISSASPEMKWVMENISIQNKKTEYLLNETDAQSDKLTVIEEQVKYTNGKVKDNTTKVEKFMILAQDLEQLVGTKKFIEKISGSKWTWIVIGLIIAGLYQVAINPTLREWVSKLF